MSLVIQPQPSSRLNRCQLFGPGSRPELFEKMASSKADVINLDLEDSVSPNDKEKARKNVIEAIREIDWNNKTLSVRINGLDGEYWYKDVVELLEADTDRLNCIMIPKVGSKSDIYAVEALVSSIEISKRRKSKLDFEAIIETAAGLSHIEEIASSSKRLVALSFGAADFAASMGMQTTGIGGTQNNYFMLPDKDSKGNRLPNYSDPWHMISVSIVAACRTHGVLPVDGPFGDFSDEEGFIAQAKRSATLGMVGKWAIHPKQVDLANKVFSPSEEQVKEAKEILNVMADAEKASQGAAVYKGRLVDIASIKQAKVIVDQFNNINKNQ